jgi:queuosine precursor transporter
MNEVIFFSHVFIVLAGTFFSLKLGKEGLATWTSLLGVTANLFVLKQISLFTLTVTCADVYIVGTLLGLNLLQEFYGKSVVQKVIWINFFSLLAFALLSQIHLFYVPAKEDLTQGAYHLILGQGPRIFLASITAYFLTLQCDTFLFGKIKEYFKEAPLHRRNFFSLAASQALDTVTFTLLALYGQVNSLLAIMCFSYIVKLLVILLTIPCTKLTRKWITA